MDVKTVEKLERDARRVLEWGEDELDDARLADYSGRGMFGATSALAFQCDVDPRSVEGHKLQALGLTCDNLGYGWVYYTRRSAS